MIRFTQFSTQKIGKELAIEYLSKLISVISKYRIKTQNTEKLINPNIVEVGCCDECVE